MDKGYLGKSDCNRRFLRLLRRLRRDLGFFVRVSPAALVLGPVRSQDWSAIAGRRRGGWTRRTDPIFFTRPLQENRPVRCTVYTVPLEAARANIIDIFVLDEFDLARIALHSRRGVG
jgi:hypothetical protein